MFLVEKYFLETPCTLIIIITEMKRVRVKVRSSVGKKEEEGCNLCKEIFTIAYRHINNKIL